MCYFSFTGKREAKDAIETPLIAPKQNVALVQVVQKNNDYANIQTKKKKRVDIQVDAASDAALTTKSTMKGVREG